MLIAWWILDGLGTLQAYPFVAAFVPALQRIILSLNSTSRVLLMVFEFVGFSRDLNLFMYPLYIISSFFMGV